MSLESSIFIIWCDKNFSSNPFSIRQICMIGNAKNATQTQLVLHFTSLAFTQLLLILRSNFVIYVIIFITFRFLVILFHLFLKFPKQFVFNIEYFSS